VEAAELDIQLEELEVRLERLRALYEQYFLGIEKLEPTVARKDVDRRIYVLRREKIRNTGKRFKLQTIIQRYNTFQQYWHRICREIENGTYRRHVLRAERSFGPQELLTIAARKRFGREQEMARGELEPETAAAPADEPSPPPPQAPAPAPARQFESLDLDMDFLGDWDPGAAPKRAPATAAKAPKPARPPEPTRPPELAKPPEPAKPPAPAEPPEPAKVAEPVKAARPAKAAEPAKPPPPPRRPIPVRAPPSKPPAAPARAPGAPPAEAKSVPSAPAAAAAPPAAPTPNPVRARKPLPKAEPKAPATAAPRGLDETRIRELHGRLNELKRQNREAGQVSLEGLTKSLRATEEKLRKQHAGRSIDFDVVVKNGRAVVKPIVR